MGFNGKRLKMGGMAIPLSKMSDSRCASWTHCWRWLQWEGCMSLVLVSEASGGFLPPCRQLHPRKWGPVTERCAALTTAQHVCYDGHYFTFVLVCRAVFGGWGHAACSTASVMAEGAEQRMGQTGGCSTSTTVVLGTACLPVGASVGWHLVS